MSQSSENAIRPHRDPLCACCRKRHKVGGAVAYPKPNGRWYCARCDGQIDGDGECGTEKCCGNP